MSLGETIRKLRIERGLSQKGLGELCNPPIDASNIRRIENNDKANPTVNTLAQISEALGVSILDFFIPERDKYIEKAQDNPAEFQKEMLYSELFEYVCEQNGYIISNQKIIGWGDSFRLFDDSEEFIINHEAVCTAFDRLIQHLSIELASFLEINKKGDGKE